MLCRKREREDEVKSRNEDGFTIVKRTTEREKPTVAKNKEKR